MTNAWYLPAESYYVAEQDLDDYPRRQGDLFPAPAGESSWAACQLLHPTCELAKDGVRTIQVIRVRRFDEIPPGQHPALTVGWTEKGGAVRVAFANTFFLPPIPAIDPEAPLFADFRSIALVPREALDMRLAALTHEARVTFIRRHMNFQYRFPFTYELVREWEGKRIANDSAFVGPRPHWSNSES